MRIHILDVGKTKYGDCVLITRGTRRILIDGAHPGDTARIRSQLKTVLGQNPPFDIDLLVVTHCHNDHIGCLPTLIAGGDLNIKKALVADEKLGWGRAADGDSPVDAKGLSDVQRGLVAALQEEDHSDLPPDELAQFLQDAGTLEDKYTEMLDGLGAKVVRYGRDAAAKVQQIETAFADFGLRVLGPTKDHLVTCAAAIAQASDAIADAVGGADTTDLAGAYKRLSRRFGSDVASAADQPGVGAAKNDQSIVLKVEADGWSALLGGDMQFAKAEVPGLTPLVTALRQKVVAAGPYDFIKLTHHTSYNAVDASVLDEWSATKLFAHTGGSNDAGHPDEGVLELLTERQDQFTFARTDRNGLITVAKVGGVVTMAVSKGETNDFGVNQPPDLPEPTVEPGKEPAEEPPPTARVRGGVGDVVEVITRVPHTATTVTVTIRVEPGAPKVGGLDPAPRSVSPAPAPRAAGGLKLGGGRALPKLLFVTCRPRLERNIGKAEAARVFDTLGRAPAIRVVDLPEAIVSAERAAAAVRPQLAAHPAAGVVILGGFDVVPAHRLDVLAAAARQQVEDAGLGGADADDFIVWSDELYGDRDGDEMPEVPVSRIPDGRRADVVFAALQAKPRPAARRFGVRNLKRPFATGVFANVAGVGELLVSEPLTPEEVPTGAATGAVYYMLHGSARDGTRFWGETAGGAAYEAVAVENVPADTPGAVVFTGCCWGALSMSPPAARARPGTPLRPRGPEASIAVAYLKAGAIGFVGCTGSHYSPLAAPFDYFGKPMHDAFWAAVGGGAMPASALFAAKREFARRMPHGRTDAFSVAVELKILRQFTCLGLGW